MNRLPVITGIGLVTPLGADAPATWDALLRGEYIRDHARVKLDREPGVERVSQLAARAAREATQRAGWSADELTSNDTALVVGTSKGPVEMWLAAPPSTSDNVGPAGRVASCVVHGVSDVASRLACELKLGHGARVTLSAACASGLHALVRAAMMVRDGTARRALVVAAESSLHPLFIGSFKRLGVLPAEGVGCRPFDVERDGFLMSEAAAAVCLEADNEHPARGDVRVEHFAIGADAVHLTSGDPNTGMLRRLLSSVTDGQTIDLVHAHGTGTILNDPVELAAIESTIAGPDDAGPSVYSHKGALGHSLGAAGLVAVAINCMAHTRGTVPPNVQTHSPLPAGRLRLSRDAQTRPIRHSIALASGFGGTAAAIRLASS
ncbi:MAG: beta-ketoacyl synthase N-terminal-like domain-containing protein, partial [Tepidisphaeraceae bacterium]